MCWRKGGPSVAPPPTAVRSPDSRATYLWEKFFSGVLAGDHPLTYQPTRISRQKAGPPPCEATLRAAFLPALGEDLTAVDTFRAVWGSSTTPPQSTGGRRGPGAVGGGGWRLTWFPQ